MKLYLNPIKRFVLLTGLGLFILAAILNSCDKKDIPIIETVKITTITRAGASSGGIIISDGNAEIKSWGVVCSDKSNPSLEAHVQITNNTIIGKSIKIYNSVIVDLIPNTDYYVRAYASNSVGTGYGQEEQFKTLISATGINFNPKLVYDSIIDIQGNVYKTIQIGTQIWMAENLRTTKFNDGTSIPEVHFNEDWAALTSGAFCWVEDYFGFWNTYGAWYNYYAVQNGNLCPANWHIPSEGEWNTLLNYLEPGLASDKLREVGITHWWSPNPRANNESGFTALPGGLRTESGIFRPVTLVACFWSGTNLTAFQMDRTSGYVNRYTYTEKFGCSVRCVKD